MVTKSKGLRRLINATFYSIAGFKAAWQHEVAFRQELACCVVLLPLAIWLGDNGVERSLLITSALLVPLIELINSAIESTLDRISVEQHPLIGRAKDLGSAAVLLAIVMTVLVWALVLSG